MKLQSLVLCLVLGLTLVLQCSEGKSTYISLLGHDMQGENDESTGEAGEGHANERRQYIPPPEFGRKKEVAFKAGEAGEGHANERRQYIPPPEFGRKKEVAFKEIPAWLRHSEPLRRLRSDE
ncbi:uncharacterized protein LOC114959761 isoform X3 [Acropora millepora]|uniref:uncharacterized protein LOC114959761 isoform X3 n=1 Tax=Acropora millepora TaxID=45264 RepID=UPI001CF136BA|nr:uncharacterized protein LOC114959761 isoform X3 [Acropora millepora]